jgi:hypothetical protein
MNLTKTADCGGPVIVGRRTTNMAAIRMSDSVVKGYKAVIIWLLWIYMAQRV